MKLGTPHRLVHHLAEEDDEESFDFDDDFKEVYGSEIPTFTFLIKGDADNQPEYGSGVFDVYVDDLDKETTYTWLGQIKKEPSPAVWSSTGWRPGWRIMQVVKPGDIRRGPAWEIADPKRNPRQIFSTQQAAAEWLWSNWNGHHSLDVQDSLNVRRLVGHLAEDDEDDDYEEDDSKEYTLDPLSLIASSLSAAGFTIERAEYASDREVVVLHLEAIARAARAEDEATRLGDAAANELAALVDRKLAEINDSARPRPGRGTRA